MIKQFGELTKQISWGSQKGTLTFLERRPYTITVTSTIRSQLLDRVIFAWRKCRNRERTALHAIPV